jgi:hypothetical protein
MVVITEAVAMCHQRFEERGASVGFVTRCWKKSGPLVPREGQIVTNRFGGNSPAACACFRRMESRNGSASDTPERRMKWRRERVGFILGSIGRTRASNNDELGKDGSDGCRSSFFDGIDGVLGFESGDHASHEALQISGLSGGKIFLFEGIGLEIEELVMAAARNL